MTYTEKDLKNKKQGDIIFYYLLIGVGIIASLFQIYLILFRHPTKINFIMLLLSIWLVVKLYLEDIKQITEKSEKKALWKIVIRGTGIIVCIIAIIVGVGSLLSF